MRFHHHPFRHYGRPALQDTPEKPVVAADDGLVDVTITTRVTSEVKKAIENGIAVSMSFKYEPAAPAKSKYKCICGRDTKSGPVPVHWTSGHSVTCQHYNWSQR